MSDSDQRELAQDYLSVIEAMKHEAAHPDNIEAVKKLVEQHDYFLKLLESESKASNHRAIKTNIGRIEERLIQLDGAAFFGDAAESLAPFDLTRLDDDAITRYVILVNHFHTTGNGYFAMEVFAMCTWQGMNPPTWVMRHLLLAFLRHIYRPDAEKNTLLKDLGLIGKASGATSFRDEAQGLEEDYEPMRDMGRLIRRYGLSQTASARCVIMKYDLDYSESTAKRRFKKQWGFIREGVQSKRDESDPEQISDADETKFFDSFPPKAKTIIRKAKSR